MSFPDLGAAVILVVDDQPSLTTLMGVLLRQAGYSRIHISNNSMAVTRMFDDLQPDIVLLDLGMPGLSGMDLMKQIRQMDPQEEVPIVVVSGESDRETLIAAITAGAMDFLTKPFTRDEVHMRVRNALRIRFLQQASARLEVQAAERVREWTEEAREAQREIVCRVGGSVEYREDESGRHVQRVSRCVELIALAAGVEPGAAALMRDASTLHDIGKLVIPEFILLKPARLTQDEWELAKAHASAGAKLLADGHTPLLREAERIARSHHERWDGGGYPQGLAGEEIPLGARITALCDVFDTLLSKRPWKLPWPPDDVHAEIMAQSGRQFDPLLADVFLRKWGDLLEVRAKLPDVPVIPACGPRP